MRKIISRYVAQIFNKCRPYFSPAQLNTVVVLGSILSLGIWGHLNHWQFVHDEDHSEATAHHAGESHGGAAHHDVAATGANAPELLKVETRPSEPMIEANGTLVHNPNYVAELSTRTSGTVWRVLKKVGDQVQAGEVLALVEAAPVGEAKAELLKALVQNDLRARTLARLEGLSEVVSEKKIQEARAASHEASIRLFDAQQVLSNLGLPVNLDQFQGKQDQELATKVMTLGVPDSILKETGNQSLTANLIPIVAPFEGEVIKAGVVIGEQIRAAQPEFTVADRKHYWITLNVHREDAGRISVGQPVHFKTDGAAQEFTSTISWISTEVDETTRTLQARADLILDQEMLARLPHLHANVLGTGRIQAGGPHEVAVVPPSCLLWTGDHYEVRVKSSSGALEDRTVRVGSVSETEAEIVGGLQAGDSIALQPVKVSQTSDSSGITQVAHFEPAP
ncbi:MAG: efflux RND transporter periplasmic adaptor subunit [Planctomycetales bacterium]